MDLEDADRRRLDSRLDRPIEEQMLSWLALVMVFVSTVGCATGRPSSRPISSPKEPVVTIPGTSTRAALGNAISRTALSYQGVPYRPGGSDPSGFDCSGFVQFVFAQHRILTPRQVRDQSHLGSAIRVTGLVPGDLLFFSTDGRGPSHVAIAIDAERFVHAPSSRGVVRVESLHSSYWRSRYLMARRLSSLNSG